MNRKSLSIIMVMALATPPALAAPDCAALAGFSWPGHEITIRSAKEVPAGAAPANPQGPPAPPLPAHCRVDGVIDARTGHGGKPYGIGFAVALPAKWNGRFLFQGGGGLNGSVAPPVGGQYAGSQSALERGFAVATTDSGHQSTGFDASFFADQEAALDFLYQAVAEVTVVAKEIVARHYGKRADHAYFVGCSTGGREAMMMSQRFPRYYDGIVAVAPAMRTSFSNLGLRHAATALNAVAPRDAAGKPQTREALGDAGRRLIIDGMLEACDALDGQRDGFVFAPHHCRFDPGVLECKSTETPACLTSAQVKAVRLVMQGPRTASGRQVYPGYWFDTGIANTSGLAGILAAPFIPEGPVAGTTMDVDAAAAEAMSARAMVGDTDAWTNLGTFRGHGGKLIFAHGVSDPWFSAQDTVQYYERLGRGNSDVPLAQWSRLFLVPGMGHCGGGARTLDRFDLLSAITDWVEQSHAPDRVIATGASAPGESRPLCAYPGYAHYAGTGSVREASNYRCQAPPANADDRAQAMAEMRKRHDALPDTPGTGRYPAIKEVVPSLPGHVVYRPANLDGLGTRKLGIYVFGNGACSNDGASARLHLLEIASHGYLAIAPGQIRNGPGAIADSAPPPPRPPQENPAKLPTPPTTSKDLLTALDWAIAQNADAKSPLRGRIDTGAVAISGFSCGGLQALQIASDPRVKTLIVMNSGIFKDNTQGINGIDVSKALLDEIHSPTFYILGGETDIAYANGMDDVARIRHVPVYVGNLDVGHGGTYWEPNGGKAAAAVVSWLEWQLRGDAGAARMFVGEDCGLCRDPAWRFSASPGKS